MVDEEKWIKKFICGIQLQCCSDKSNRYNIKQKDFI